MAPPRPHVVVVGSSNTDLVLHCDRLPGPGETVLGGELGRYAGGKGANQAVAAARAGARVSFIGATGRDDFGRAARAALRREGVGVRYLAAKDGVPSGVALIFVGGRSRQNQIGVARSANDHLAAEDVEQAAPLFRSASVVLAQLEVPFAAVEAAGELAARHGVPFVLNPGPVPRRPVPRAILALADTVTPNEQEAEALTGESEPLAAARRLLETGCGRAVVTLGARGALVVTLERELRLPAARVRPVDTVGAGDCFTAWLAVGLAEGLRLEAASRRAIRAAAIQVTRRGAQAAMPYRREVERRS